MRKELILAQFASELWALQPELRCVMEGVLLRWQSGAAASQDVMKIVAADRAARSDKTRELICAGGGSIAVIPLMGVITQRGNMVADISGPGSSSTQQVAQSIRAAIADDSIAQICIVADSPGGSVYGISELCAELTQARSRKPIVGIADSLASSAAYWILASCGEVYVTPGGEVGSIGVWQAHQDVSKAMEKTGVKTTLISAGKFKTEGNQFEPLDSSAQDYMQGRVDDYYRLFVRDVAKGRSTTTALVRSDMGQGRMLGADAALRAGMVDGIATFDQVIAKMVRSVSVTRPSLAQMPARTSKPKLAAALRGLEISALSGPKPKLAAALRDLEISALSHPTLASEKTGAKRAAAERAAFLLKMESEIRQQTRRNT